MAARAGEPDNGGMTAREALGWLRREFEHTLDAARQRLNAFAESPDRHELLEKFCREIHQVAGVLAIIRLESGRVLAEHMEALAEAVRSGRRAADAEYLEPLMRASLELSDYFDRLAAGLPDPAAALLPTTNEIRALLDEAPLERQRLGRPTPGPKAGAQDLAGLAAEVRPRYQAALLAYYRGAQPQSALSRMREIVGRLERASAIEPVFEFFWVAGGILEALEDGGLSPTLGVKRLLGHVERELKRLEKTSEEALAEHPPDTLLGDLLAQVARARSRGERVTAIRGNFRLGDEPGPQELEVGGPGAGSALMRSVGGAILEDLERVRDRIDLFVRTGRKEPQALAPLGGVLKKVADALGMLGLTAAQSRVEHERESIRQLAAGNGGDQAGLLHLATELIGIESEVETFLLGTGGDPQSAAARAARATGLRETLAEVARIKATLTEHLRYGGRPQAVAALPAHADRVARVLDFLELDGPAGLVRRIACYLERMPGLDAATGAESLDRLADAVVSVEYFLETLASGREPRASMLENADRALAALGVGGDEGTVEARARHRASAPREAAPVAPRPVIELAPVRAATADSVVAEVFVEEVPEVAEALAGVYPRWRANPADRDTLATMRRAFQTLRGSGRMAGAERLSEFALAVEELLNRLLDLAVSADHETVAVVGDAVAAIPQLLEEFARGAAPTVDVAALMERVAGLARVEEAPAPAAESPAPAPEAAAGTKPRLPQSLYEIYRGEVLEHLAVLEAWRDACASGAERLVTPALSRAVHTLVGSARMAGAGEMDALMTPLEEALERGAAPNAITALLDGVVEAGRQLLDAYGDEDRPLPDWGAARDRVTALRDSLPVVSVPERSFEPEPAAEPLAEEPLPPPEPAVEDRTEPGPAPAEEVIDLADQPGYDSELVQLFAGEAAELLEGVDAALGAWGEHGVANDPLTDLLRRLHTLKGGARMAGIAPFADLVHDLESFLGRISDGELSASRAHRQLAVQAFDRLYRMLEHVNSDGRVASAAALRASLQQAMGLAAAAAPEPAAPPPEAAEAGREAVAPVPAVPAEPEAEPERGSEAATEAEAEAAERARAVAEAEAAERERAAAAAEAAAKAEAEAAERERAAAAAEAEAEAEEEAEAEAATASAAEPEPVPLAAALSPTGVGAAIQKAEAVRQRYRRMGLARVRADLLEAAINSAGEVGIFRGRLEQHVVTMNLHLAELERTVERVRGQMRELEIETEAQILSSHEQEDVERLAEFDPLEFDRYTRIQELSRSLAEAVSDLLSLRGLFATELHQAEASLERQGRVNAELQDALLRTRMMPFALSEGRLRRVVRQVAEETGKTVELKLVGMEGEMDRQILEHVLPALEHLLRNAVVHGIEEPKLRRARGKPETGTIELTLRREGAETVVEVADDGGGLDLAGIRARGVAEGLIAADAELSGHELADLIFRTGFSTADVLSQAAGRGVGMDVVATEIRHTGGNVELDSRPGHGLRVLLRLPSGLAITHALIVRVGARRYPVPLASIEGITRLTQKELQGLLEEETPAYEFGGRRYELASLHEALGEEPVPAEDPSGRVPLLMAGAGERHAAFIVDDMEGSREIVVKPVGPQVGRIPGISGATAFGDGSIGLLLDLPGLVRAMPRLEAKLEARTEALTAEPLVMVVDDSITVRRVTERMLARHSVRVMTAKDGLEALELLADHTPDLMLLDIEMPRMDGYELAGRMKADARLRTVPIIVITSRAGEKHRARAEQIGIERYLGKPYQESELLAAIAAVMRGFDLPASRATP